ALRGDHAVRADPAARVTAHGIDVNRLPCGVWVLASQARPRTSLRPDSTRAIVSDETRPIRSLRKVRSAVRTCETLTTDGFLRPVPLGGMATLPGRPASLSLVVMTTTRIVAIRLRLKALA